MQPTDCRSPVLVHGDIRHLENAIESVVTSSKVHGDIRHLESGANANSPDFGCSWRHTPFRNLSSLLLLGGQRSWRHTPFRNLKQCRLPQIHRSWRHTPFRKLVNTSERSPFCSWRHTPFRNDMTFN